MEFNCSECDKFWATEVDEMAEHIIKTHSNYTPLEAAKYAQIWLDNAWDEHDAKEIDWGNYN